MENKYVIRYERKLRNADKSEDTIKSYMSDIKQMIKIIGKEPEDIKAVDLDDTYADFLEGLASTSRARKIVAINGFFDYLKDLELITKNPAAILEAPKNIQTEVRYTPSKQEVEKMIKFSTNIKTKAIVTLLAQTGLRFSEMKNIKLNEITDGEKVITDKINICGKGRKYRDVYLSKDTIEMINEYLKTRKDGADTLFTSNQGTELDNKSIWKMVRTLAKRTGMENWDKMETHAFRRYAITEAHKKGLPPMLITKMFGHSSLDVESKHYVYFTEDEMRNAVN